MNPRSRQMYAPICLAFVFAVCLVSHVQSDACDDLKQCTNNIKYGANGTWSFLKLKSFPSSQSVWTTFYSNICSTKATRTQCAESSTCTNNATVTNAAEVAKKDTAIMCSANGLNFLRRLYTEETNCLGNTTMVQLARSRRTHCKNTYLDTITTTMTNSQKCSRVSSTRTCLRSYMGQKCGDLHRWMIDQTFKALTEVYYPSCVSALGTMFAFPAESS